MEVATVSEDEFLIAMVDPLDIGRIAGGDDE